MNTTPARAFTALSLLILWALPADAQPLAAGKSAEDFHAESVLIVHYHRPAGDYEGWNVWAWPIDDDGDAHAFAGVDDFGPYIVIPYDDPHQRFGLIVRKGEWEAKDGDADRFADVNDDGVAEVWIKQGEPRVFRDPAAVGYQPQTPGQSAATPDMTRVRPLAPASAEGALLVINYYNPEGESDWDVWAWADGEDGRAVTFTRDTAFGKAALVRYDDRKPRVNFIVRKPDWSRKDVDMDRSAVINEQGVGEVWLVAGDERVYTDPADIDWGPKVTSAFLDALDQVRVTLSQPIPPAQLGSPPRLRVDGRPIDIRSALPHGLSIAGTRDYTFNLASSLTPDEIARPMVLEIPGYEPVRVEARNALEDPAFNALDARLGYEYASDATTFRTWSPTATGVDLLLFDSATADEPRAVVPMRRDERFVWQAEVDGDLDGTYYLYRFDNYGEPRTVPDIHGYAATKDSARSLVLDLRKTDPDGFRDHQPPTLAQPTDEVIYEIHVRDLSVADPSTPAEHRGKYLGLTHLNPADARRVSTGLSHLKDLGVTAVHLLPIQDFSASMDEYNWGYWTALFNVPEAQYSTRPDDPAATIRELKQAIQTLHDHGLRVILDVVYNHTSSSFEHSPFDQAVPWYYFRTTPDGRLRNESGTGNAFADERPMARKYIVDSLLYWVDEYKVDGFRFDLVGMHHPQTVREITQALRAARPDLTLYGEPWTGGGPIHFPKGAQRGTTMAVFNDHLRNAVRGDLDGASTGFATGPGGDRAAVQRGVAGAIDDFTDDPTETINYVSAHDNRTFWDKIEYTHADLDDPTKRAMQKLAHGIVLTSQGIPFIHGGAGFARTKGGHHNSYNAGDAVNAFDWPRKARYLDVHDYLTGLIALRKDHPAFRMATADAVRANLRFLDSPGVLAFALNGKAVGDAWDTILVAYNGEPTAQRLDLPAGRWAIVVNAERAGTRPLDTTSGAYTLPPYSMIVAYQD